MPASRSSASPDRSLPETSTPPSADVPSADVEWLLCDGRGGYACGTANGLPTRRYHGLWIARPEGSARRRMLVAGLAESVGVARRIGDEQPEQLAHLLHAHWRSQPAPTPPSADVTFARRPLPTWTFATLFGEVERSVALRREADGQASALLVRWRNLSGQRLRLLVRSLLGCHDVDHLPPVDDGYDATVKTRGASWGFRPVAGMDTLWLTVDGVAAFTGEATWYRDFLLRVDRERGYDHVAHRWSPGVLELDLPAGGEATAAFACAEPVDAPAEQFDAQLQVATAHWRAVQQSDDVPFARLALGADDFLYRGEGGRLGVLAGFPWFGEWGRDVFLALPGLTLARDRADLCADVLTGALPFLHRGLLPNIYGRDVADSRYNSCDAALWFALAVQRFADGGHDPELVERRLLPALRSIVDAYREGAELGLVSAADGLLHAGGPELNATWMDAQTSDGPVTPREGLPVEIQALWYSLLAFLVERGGDRPLEELRDRCGRSFVKQFWLKGDGCLADRVHEGVADRSVRPNMLVAAALPRSPLSNAQRQGTVKVAEQQLVTPVGLRTLSPQDPRYIGRYQGGVDERDNAYHQGTVWPWLCGFFVEASLRGAPKRSKKKLAQERLDWLRGVLVELDRAGLGHVSEVFDGDEPRRPGGTFAQAWNTGELLRARALCAAVLADGELSAS